MKKSLILIILSFCSFLSCTDNTSSGNNTDYLILKGQVIVLQDRLDSLISVIKDKQSPAVIQKQKKKAKSNNKTSNALSSYSPEKPETKTPPYKPKKEKQAYQVRVGAMCCDGSRSYATGRGACSHHGGVCEWLYE